MCLIFIFSFSLFNCQVGSGLSLFEVYIDQCPNAEVASVYNLKWIDLTTFDISVFQIRNLFDEPSLTFSCEVRTYGHTDELPPFCNATSRTASITTTSVSRKRRDLQKTKGTFYTIKNDPLFEHISTTFRYQRVKTYCVKKL